MLRVVLATGLLALVVACGESERLPVPVMVVTATPAPTPTPVPFETLSFKVDAGNASRVTIDAFAGNEIQFEFSADLDINVRLVGPDGGQLGRWDRVNSRSMTTVTARSSGDHEMIFDNSFSLVTPKSVTLTVRVVPGR